jgi:uncharacterized damage-inducible protein DinB
MLEMLRDLVAHKGHANAALLEAVGQHPAAAADPELVDLLHHVLLANRFWLLTTLGQPFVLEDESRRSPSIEALAQRYARLQAVEAEWLDAAAADEPGRTLASPLIPNGTCSVAQAYVQVCLHSHGHRAQAAKMLRHLGGTPPASDFILWLATRERA